MPIAIFIILLSFPKVVFAQVLNTRPAVMIYYYSSENVFLLGYLNSSDFTYNAQSRELSTAFAYYYYSPRCTTAQEAYNYYLNNIDKGGADGVIYSPQTSDSYFIVIKGNCTVINSNNANGLFFDSYDDYEDYINPPEPDSDTWYEILWNDFTHWIDEIGDSLSEGYQDFINWINGESTHGGGHEFRMPDVVRPSPIPTPIPYNTVIVPKTDPNTGDTYYEYNYVYNNPSGTPIITGSPSPNVDINVNDNDFEYPYYYNPDNRNNPYYFEMPWYLKFINGTNVFDLDDMSENLDVMETAINDNTISDGVTSAYSSMATLPTNWIQLVGLIASIPLIGCLIARFLKG